jgi:hypothetical protein
MQRKSGAFLRDLQHKLKRYLRQTGDTAGTGSERLCPLAALVVEALVIVCLKDLPPHALGSDKTLRQCVHQRWSAVGPDGLRRVLVRGWRLALVAIASAVDREGRLWPHLDAGWSAVELLIRDFDSDYLLPFADGAGLLPQQRAKLRRELMHTCGRLLGSVVALDDDGLDWTAVDLDDLWPVEAALDDLALPAAAGETVAVVRAQLGKHEDIPPHVCDLLTHRNLLVNTLRHSLHQELINQAQLESYLALPGQDQVWVRQTTKLIASLHTGPDRFQQLLAETLPQLTGSVDSLVEKLWYITAHREAEDAEIEARWQNLQFHLQQELKVAPDMLAWLEPQIWHWGSPAREMFTLETYLGERNGRLLYSARDRQRDKLFVEVALIGTGEGWVDNTVQFLTQAARCAQTAPSNYKAGYSLAQQECFTASPTPHPASVGKLLRVYNWGVQPRMPREYYERPVRGASKSDDEYETNIEGPFSLALPFTLPNIISKTIVREPRVLVDVGQLGKLNKHNAPMALAPIPRRWSDFALGLREYQNGAEIKHQFVRLRVSLTIAQSDRLAGKVQWLLDLLWRLTDLLQLLEGQIAVAGLLPREQTRRSSYFRPEFVEAGITPMSSMADVDNLGYLSSLALDPDFAELQNVATRLVHDAFLYRIVHPRRLVDYRRTIQNDPLFGFFQQSVLAGEMDVRVMLVATSLLQFVEPVALAEKLGEDAVVVLTLLGEPLKAIELGEMLLSEDPDNLWLHHSLALLYLWQADEAWRAQ